MPYFLLGAASLTDIAALVTAIGGVIIGFFAARRTHRSDKATADAAGQTSIMEGYAQIVNDLREEISRIRAQAVDVTEQTSFMEGYAQIVKDLREEISRIRNQYTEDLLTWKTEKGLMLQEQDNLRNQYTEDMLIWKTEKGLILQEQANLEKELSAARRRRANVEKDEQLGV